MNTRRVIENRHAECCRVAGELRDLQSECLSMGDLAGAQAASEAADRYERRARVWQLALQSPA